MPLSRKGWEGAGQALSREPGYLPGKAEWPLSAQGAPQTEPGPIQAATPPYAERPGRSSRVRVEQAEYVSARSRSPVVARLASGGALLAACAAALVVAAAAVGPYTIPLSHTAGILLEQFGLPTIAASDTERAIVESIRLSRITLALVVGAALGVAGAVMQGLFRNPMADPGIIGVSTGGALGAVVAIAIGAPAASALALPVMAFAGAAGALGLVFAVASVGGRFSMAALLLSGVAVSAFLAAIISAIVLLTQDLGAQREMIFWLAGGLDASRWTHVRMAAPLVLAGVAVAVLLTRDLNLLMVGEQEARALGVRVGLIRTVLLLAASLITGTAVAFSGTIAFVGLIVPHALRLITGADHRVLVPLSALGGAVFLLAADTVARVVVAPAEVRVGIVTALVGAPFFLFLLARHKTRAGLL